MSSDLDGWIQTQLQTTPGRITLGASILALALAGADFWRDGFDGELTVLTLTLVVVIWYTRFTYELAENAKRSLKHSLERSASSERNNRQELEFVLQPIEKFIAGLPTGSEAEIVWKLRQNLLPAPRGFDVTARRLNGCTRRRFELVANRWKRYGFTFTTDPRKHRRIPNAAPPERDPAALYGAWQIGPWESASKLLKRSQRRRRPQKLASNKRPRKNEL